MKQVSVPQGITVQHKRRNLTLVLLDPSTIRQGSLDKLNARPASQVTTVTCLVLNIHQVCVKLATTAARGLALLNRPTQQQMEALAQLDHSVWKGQVSLSCVLLVLTHLWHCSPTVQCVLQATTVLLEAPTLWIVPKVLYIYILFNFMLFSIMLYQKNVLLLLSFANHKFSSH